MEDPTQVASPTAETTPEPTTDATPEPTTDATPEPTTDATPEPTTDATPAPTVAPDPLSLVFSTGFEDDATELSVQGWMSVNVENGKALQSGPEAPILTYNTAYPNIALRLRVLLQDGTLSLALRQNGASSYTFILGPEGTLVLLRNGEEVASTQVALVPREWFMLEARAIGGALSVSINGIRIFNYVEPTPLPAGGLSVTSSAAALVRIDDLAILASDTAGDEVTLQAQLYWGQPIISCHSTGTQVTHTWWFAANYWNYIIDFKRTSGDLRYDVYITGPSINGTLPSAPDGRMIIYGPDNGGGPAGNYSLTITGTSGSGCMETTIWSGYRPQNQIGWGFQSSNFTLKKWRYNLSSTMNHQVRVERTEGSGPINLKIWSPGGALLANTSSATGVIVWDYSNGPSGEYNVEIDISNGSYRWAVNGGLVHLAKPTGVTVTNRTHTSATISWIDNSVGEQDYVVYSPDGFNPILLPPDTRSYTFTGLNCSSSYRVIVYSKIANRNSEAGQIGDVPFSDFGNTPSFSTLPCQPAPTLNLPADGATLTTLRPSLSWFALAGQSATRYA